MTASAAYGTTMDARLRALNRFGLGARPGERDRVGDPRDWLKAQLTGGPPQLASVPATDREISDALQALGRAAAGGTDQDRAEARRRLMRIAVEEQRAALTERILRQNTGPNVAAVEFSGWDTHANQGAAGGVLDRLLGQLAEGLVAFRTEMGDAWSDTTVVVMTEFGRDLRPTLDTRAVLKGAIAGTFDLTAAQADRVFPGSEGVRGLYEMTR